MSKIVRKSNVSCRVSGDRAFLFDPGSERYFGLNSVGLEIWRVMESPVQVDSVVTKLSALYAVDKGQLEADVMELVSSMLLSGIAYEIPEELDPKQSSGAASVGSEG